MTDEQAPQASEGDWWSDPDLPWRQEPTRADKWCLGWMGFVAVYNLVMLPLRPVMLGLSPHVLGALAYRTGLVMVGALASVGDPHWGWIWLVGSLMAMKFDWIYWWAGKLWGRNIMDVFARGKSARTQRAYEQVWALAHRFEIPAIVLTFLPVPLPAGVIYAALGAAGTRLVTFLSVCFASALVTTAGYLYLGYTIGAPAVELMDAYGRYLWYVSIAMIVGMVGWAWYRSKTPDAAASA